MGKGLSWPTAAQWKKIGAIGAALVALSTLGATLGKPMLNDAMRETFETKDAHDQDIKHIKESLGQIQSGVSNIQDKLMISPAHHGPHASELKEGTAQGQ